MVCSYGLPYSGMAEVKRSWNQCSKRKAKNLNGECVEIVISYYQNCLINSSNVPSILTRLDLILTRISSFVVSQPHYLQQTFVFNSCLVHWEQLRKLKNTVFDRINYMISCLRALSYPLAGYQLYRVQKGKLKRF